MKITIDKDTSTVKVEMDLDEAIAFYAASRHIGNYATNTVRGTFSDFPNSYSSVLRDAVLVTYKKKLEEIARNNGMDDQVFDGSLYAKNNSLDICKKISDAIKNKETVTIDANLTRGRLVEAIAVYDNAIHRGATTDEAKRLAIGKLK